MSEWKTLPGETPLDDLSGLLRKEIRTRGELAIAEAENLREAVVKYLGAKPSPRLAPFDLNWSLKLHGEMFGKVWEWAGVPRQQNLNLGIPWEQISSSLLRLFEDLRFWEANWNEVLEQGVHLHHRAVSIHPFQNGNGRWGRMLSNVWLRQHETPIVRWPEETAGGVSRIRDEYLEAMREGDRGRYGPLIELHRRYSE